MIGMCGEFPADQLNRLIPSASYAEKLITDLKAEHLIRTHYRDALRGYRLTKAAKEMLLSVSPATLPVLSDRQYRDEPHPK